MKFCFRIGLYLNLVFLVSHINAQFNPLRDPEICGRPTCEPINKFNYTTEVNYRYQYTVDIRTLFAGSSKNESKLFINSHVSIEFLSQCEGTLQLSDLKLSEEADKYDREEDIDIESPQHSHSEQFNDAISKYPLRFSYHNGVIGELCPEEDELNWVLNFKRGVLSMFQNTMYRFDMDHVGIETDVNGVCSTKYNVLESRGSSLILEKIRDIDSCQSRYKHHSILQTTPYVYKSANNQIPLMKSTSKCELSIDHSIYNQISCTETHLFKPFSKHESGATTITKQKLTLLGEEVIRPEDRSYVRKRTSLLYDHIPTPKPTTNELKQARDMIKNMCVYSKDDLQTEFSHAFSNFITVARLLSYSTLTTIYTRGATFCPTGRKHVMDALPFLGSDAAVELMKDIIIKKQISDALAAEWMFSFGFIPRPTTKMLEVMLPLIEHESGDAGFPLSVASMVHSYCRWYPDCESTSNVQHLISSFENIVNRAYKSKFKNRVTREKILAGLKSLGNIGIISETFKTTLHEIIEDTNLPIEIRVAGIDAHRRLPCGEYQKYFMNIYRNFELDVEIRVAAYLQIMKCPDYLTIQEIKYVLKSEEVNQVGSFVWTHLNNLLKSSSPTRIEIQGLLSDKDLGRKFNSDVRKFSNNFEKSVFFEEYNAGGSCESNVIFSTESYIPRKASLNLTVDLFGESINLLEVDGRIEGFEQYFEALFGPNRTFNPSNVKEKLLNLRPFRSADDKNAIKSQMNNIPNVLEDNFKPPMASLGLKIFGNDLKYNTFVGNDEIFAALNTLNPVTHIKRLLSGKEISYEKAAVLLDTSYIVPTGTGLPVTLNAAGTAAINLKMRGALRSADFMKTGEMDIEGYFKPSVAIDVIGSMTVDAYYASTGIKVKTNLYTSTDVLGTVNVRFPRSVSVQFKLPKNKTEIFGAQSELIILKNDIEEYQTYIEDENKEMNSNSSNIISETSCSWPILDKVIGLKLCSSYKLPNVSSSEKSKENMFFHGPTKFRVYIEKADPTAEIYLLEYKWKTEKNAHKLSLIYDTPNSEINRMISANLTIDLENKNVSWLLKSTGYTISAQGTFVNTDSEKMINLTFHINGKKHFSGEAGYKKTLHKYGYTYYPKFFLGVNDERIAELDGTLKWITKKNTTQCDVNLTFDTKKLRTKLIGYISLSDITVAMNLKLDYKFEKGNNEIVRVEGFLKYEKKGTIFIHGNLQLTSTAYPQFNFISSLKYRKGVGHIECKIEINNSPDLTDEKHKLTLLFVFSVYRKIDGAKFNTHLAITKPINQLDMKFEVEHEKIQHKTNTRVLIRYAKEREIIVTLFLSLPTKSFFYLEGKLTINLPTFTPMVLDVQIDQKTAKKYNIDIISVWFSGHSLTASGIYQDRSTVNSNNHHIKLSIKSPSFNDITVNGIYSQDDLEFKTVITANHNNDEYSILLKHLTEEHQPLIVSYGEIKYKHKMFSALSLIDLKDKQQIILEVHLDQIRDVYILLKSVNLPKNKFLGGEIKWDSNRDPNQKLALSVEYFKHESYNTTGVLLFSYPGRTVKGEYNFALKETLLRSSGLFAWSSKDIVSVTVNADYKHDYENTMFLIDSEILTPFETWEKASLNGGIQHKNNLYNVTGSIYWRKDEYIALNLHTDYEITPSHITGEFLSSIESTITDIPSVSLNLQHKQGESELDDRFYFMYHPQQVVAMNSTWKIDTENRNKILTGTVSILSPYENCRKGLLLSKFTFTEEMDIKGYAEFDVDSRKYTGLCEGRLKRILDSKFDFNITTPIEKHKIIIGRFGLNEDERHLVAEIKSSSNAVGIEVLFQANNIIDFDVLFSIATPIDFLKNAILVGKLKNEAIDFRLGWNNLLIGFAGRWRYAHIKDFDYAYKLYTPLEGIEENGVVARFILNDGLDMDISANLAKSRLGITILGKPNRLMLESLGVPPPQPILLDSKPVLEYSEEEEDDEDEEELVWKSYVVDIAIDMVIYPTMTGNFDFNQIDTTYILVSTINIPPGTINLREEFRLDDYVNQHNRLQITTPFKNMKEITSRYDLTVTLFKTYSYIIDFCYKNNTKWIKTGVDVNYNTGVREVDDVTVYDGEIRIVTPFESIPHIKIGGKLEVEENNHKTNISLVTETIDIAIAGSLENDEGFLDSWMHLKMVSPHLTITPTLLSFRKDFSEVENSLALGCTLKDNSSNSYKLELMWKLPDNDNIRKGKFKLSTPLVELQHVEIYGVFDRNKNDKSGSMTIHTVYNEYFLKLNSTLKNNVISADIETFVQPYRKVNMELKQQIDEKQDNITFNGYIKTEKETHLINGYYIMNDGIPVVVKFNPGSGFVFEYILKEMDNGYTLDIDFEENELNTAFNVSAKIQITNKINWALSIETKSSSPMLNKIQIETEMKGPSSNNVSLDIKAVTPILRLENLELKTNIILLPEKSAIGKASYVIQQQKGNLETKVSWELMRNMRLNLITDNNLNKNSTNHIAFDIFYINRDGSLKDLKTGVDLNVGKDLWAVGSNITINYITPTDIDMELNIKTPKPNADVHKIISKYHKQNGDNTKITGLLAYFSNVYNRKYGVSGLISSNGVNLNGNLKMEWGHEKSKSINNVFQLDRPGGKKMIFNYHLDTPKFNQEDTFVTKLTYDNYMSYHNITAQLYFPASNNLLNTKVDYKDFTNMNGTINSTIQILPFKYIGLDFITETKPLNLKRFAKIFWPNNTAIFNSVYTYSSHFNDRSGKGKLIIEIPLATRHIAVTDYGYEEKRLRKTGYAIVNYNKKVILNGTYNCESEQRAGFEKDIVTIEIENQYTPAGILYIHQIDTDPIHDGFNPTFDIKRVELYKLHNPDHFNITGELHVRSTITGQRIHLSAHHINRTVTLDTDYDIIDQQFLNKAKLQLAKDIWLAYDLNLLNNTMDDMSEAQQIELKISHPTRNITVLGSYNISEASISSGIILKWNNHTKVKNIEAALDWKQLSTTPNHQQLIFELKHPTFEKNVTFVGEYYKDKKKLGDVKLSVEYSNDPNRKFDLSASLQNHSYKNRQNYTFEFYGTHPDTSLDVAVKSGILFYPKFYHTTHYGQYKSLLSSLEHGNIIGTLDVTNHEIEFKKNTKRDLTYFWSKYDGEYPLYTINGSGIYGLDINATGEFYLNLDEKLIKLDINVTQDASQKINMYGMIPDTRTAHFNFWRDYDDIRISDISYYIRLNHSRLITSKLLWRPDLKSDIKTGVKELLEYIVNSTNDNIEFWKKMIPSKTEEALMCIWNNAEPYVEGFVDDARSLNVLEQDINKFNLFLNETYKNNEFYIQNITSIFQYIIEELSVRRHIESVPDIINEIWEIMGESGKTLRKSFQWLLETLNEAYKKATEFSNSMMKGEGFNQISQVMKYFIEKYDKFMKDLHVAFIKYMEKLWVDGNNLIAVQWNKLLQALEPTYLKFIHYLETITWKASKEFLDFLYKRKTEIVDSPYFNQFSNFTHDVDRFYKDIMNHSIIYNMNKYSEIVWKFLKEKYFRLIPFSKELSDLYNEIIEELAELKKLPSVQFALQKYNEVYEKVKWFYDYFEIEERVQKIITILNVKITQITQTALESENKYRTAKTKFIFDPESGVLELEQKLPMSWHSFNDSMQYGEIPEIKMLHDLQNYFVSSNTTFWTMYYEYKAYTEPTTWLPPFNAYAIIAGPQHYITFDGRHYDFRGTCTYLLAHDFKDGNFSILVQYGQGAKSKTHSLYVFVDDSLIQIDLFSNNVKLVKSDFVTKLPLNIQGTFIYQENDMITVESNYGFILKCNMVFNVCKMELAGWYFGRTAGLWGTMNNEPRDDFLASTSKINNNTGRFAQSWSIDPKKCRSTMNHAIIAQDINEENKEPCDILFKSKVSQFSACFPIVDPTEYYNMCVITEETVNNLCTAASAYIESCSIENTPLRIPDVCVRCTLVNGSDVEEGSFVHFNDTDVPQSADIVFIVEAKQCNANLTTDRNINSVISFIHKELIDANITANRYSLVVFGGPDVFNKPRSIASNNHVFTTHQTIPRYFENIPIGNGSSDIFEAISYASKLIFRPGVSKTFILLPCTECEATSMELDYNVLHQLLRERDISLHILMNGEFVLPKARDIKILYGIDSETSYTKKDTTILKGDIDLKRQVKLPKAILGYCTALALETNGTVFTAKKLENKKRNAVKKFATVFAKRIAKSAVPNSCQTCECTAADTRTAFMECYPCMYPDIGYIDYGFTDEKFTSIFPTTTMEDYVEYDDAGSYDYS